MDRELKSSTSIYDQVLRRTGGYYLLVSVLAAQVITNLLIAPTIWLIQFNAAMSAPDFSASLRISILLIGLSNSLLLASAYFLHRNAFQRLQAWKNKGTLPTGTAQERLAWKEVTSFPWRYGILAISSSFLVVIIPLMLFQYQGLRLTTDQIGYTFLGGFASAVAIVIAGAFGIELLLKPARIVLLPAKFDDQIKNVVSIKVQGKLLILMIALIISGVAIVAPVGYREIVEVTLGTEAKVALREYQIQSLIISGVVILLASALASMLGRSLSDPFRELVEIFHKVEQGDLKQRASVIASDEAGELEVYFNQMITRLETLQNSLEEQVSERTSQLAAVNEVGRAVSAILDPEELIERVVNLITDRFGHYYAALFLLDPSEKWAELKSATGDTGRVLKESHHRLEVGGKSMVGSAITLKKASIALDVGAESVRFDNPLLPYTRSEIALPLVVGDRALGALDVQSTKQSAFGPQDIDTLQNMANQVAVAIENARLFQETRLRLQEVQASQRQYLQEAWSSLAGEENLVYGVGDETPGEIRLNVPIALRDQIIGQITLAGDSEWSPEERAWVESVATQAAIALENARLLDQSQKNAAFEKIVVEITSKIWSSATIEGIMQMSVRELGRALNATEAVIELKMEQGEAERNGEA
jgi:GAF domain-containing protein